MEFICTENNQYGIAADIENVYKDKGFGLEVKRRGAEVMRSNV